MANLESFKDARTIASTAALVAVATTSVYFQQKLSKIESDLQDVQKHLAAIIPYVDPQSNEQIQQIIKAIKMLDGRVAQTQQDMKHIASIPNSTPTSYKPYTQPELRTYKRLTQRGRNKDKGEVQTKPTLDEVDTQIFEDEDIEPELNEEDEDDIAAMMSS